MQGGVTEAGDAQPLVGVATSKETEAGEGASSTEGSGDAPRLNEAVEDESES